MLYNSMEMEFRRVRVRRNPRCVVCGEDPTVTTLIDYEEFCSRDHVDADHAAHLSP